MQLCAAMDKRFYSIKVHRKKQKGPNIQSNYMIISTTLVSAIDNYIKLFDENEQSGRFWRKLLVCGKPSKQPVGIHTLAAFPREIATFLAIEKPERYTGHCWGRTGGTILADQGALVLDLQRAGGWGSAGVAETYVAESTAQKRKVASIFEFDKLEPLSGSTTLLQSVQSSTLQVSSKRPALFANCSMVFNNCNINFMEEKDSE
jgi:hypothetical protein